MPAKKATKKAAKKTAGKASKKAASKKKVTAKKKTAPKKKAAKTKKATTAKKKTTRKKAAAKKAVSRPKVIVKKVAPVEEPLILPPAPTLAEIPGEVTDESESEQELPITEPEPSVSPLAREMVECEHCLGVGKCTTGDVFDMDRHQSIFQEPRLTSCEDCLEAAGKARNSKRIVACRFCKGTGKVPKF